MNSIFRRTLLLFAGLLIFSSSSFSPLLFAQCGVERESVKTGTDPDAPSVNLGSTTNTTIASMRAFTTPNPIPPNNRVGPAETTVWVINATLTLFKLESDSDYHLVIQDAAGNTMITEIPAPSCVGSSSPFLADITSARAAFDAKFTATTSFQTANIPVQITGVGMFDFPHGQTGAAPNQIELHPVLNIVFNPGQNSDFTLGASPASLSVTQGSTGSTNISTSLSGGFNSAVALSVSGLPSGVSASFSPTTIAAPGAGTSTLTFNASGAAIAGMSNVTVTASGGGVTHTTTVSLTINAAAAPDFAVSASPASVSVTHGGSASTTIATSVSGGFNSAVALSVSGLPSGVTASFSPTSIAAPGGGSSKFTFTASSTAIVGTSNVTVTATGGGITHATNVSLTIPGNNIFGIAPPDHVVIVMEENHSFGEIIGSSSAPFINSLAQQGALFTQSFAVEHPSQPNYLDLFSGTNQGVTDDSCPHTFSTENLASELSAAGLSFTGFSEGLPSAGSTVCTSGEYAEKHAPWVNFTNVPTSDNQPFTAFPTDFNNLPTVSFVIPNLLDDMHDGTIAQGDTFLQQNLSSYIQFAQNHNSLLIVTWDEDDNSSSNQVPTIFLGPMVKQGQFTETINHFNVLRTLEDLYGLTHAGSAATATPISDVWQQATADFSVSASPASLSINQGSSGTTAVSTTVSGGFNSAISLSVSGLPSGVTASFSSSSFAAPGTGSSTLTFTASTTAAVGTANVTVTATGAGVTHTVTIGLTVVAPDFTVVASPASLSVAQGTSGSSTITTAAVGGFNAAVSLSASGLPSGVTASFNPASIAAPGNGSSTLTFAASSTATTGTTTVTVTATGGGVTHTTTIALTVTATATPNFTVSASPTSLSVVQGASGNTTITTTISGGFNAAVSLSASGLPSGVTASFNPASIAAPGNGSSTLTFTASSTAATSTTNVTVTATGGGITQTSTIALTVTAAATPDFTVGASPTSVSVAQGSSGSSMITTTVSGGFNAAVSLSASALPSGVTASFNPASIAAPGNGSSTLTFTAGSTATTGTTNITVTAAGGGVTHSVMIALTVTASGGSTTTQVLGNPGFENGSGNPSPWTVTTTARTNRIINSSSNEPPHSGTFDAWLDGHGSTTTDTILQQATIPANATAATLSFWLHIDTAETSKTRAFDTLTVQVRSTSGTVLSTLATFSNLNAASGYQLHTFNLSSFKGQTIQIFLQGKEDFELQTSFVVDDFALNVTVPNGGGGGGTTTEMIGNGGFENGPSNPAPWTLTSTQTPQSIINSSSAEPPHSGSFDAWLDGFGTTTTDTIMQQVSIPANATAATLSFWLHIDTAETSTTRAFDTLTVQVLDSSGNVLSTLATFSNLDAASGYTQHSFDLTSFAGQAIQIFMSGAEDFELQTSFVLDDISLQVTQ
jgi:uncharacterized membrane protein